MSDKLRNDWVSWDPNEGTRGEVASMSDEDIQKYLGCDRIAFGTAGLRAEMGPGYGRMNDLVVLQTAQGLLEYLESISPSTKRLVLGYDHRERNTLNSKGFAEITARVFLNAGWTVYLFGQTVPTPFVPFGIKYLGASAGVMVTASHNPKNDNGYKVYWSNACQIIAPHDENIASAILRNLKPKEMKPFDINKVIDPTDEVAKHYYEAISGLKKNNVTVSSGLKIAYTAMHGIGHKWAIKSFEAFGLDPFVPVPQQVEPDPTFPTVAFPNPEEGKGALQLSFETANASGATLVLANDPDADRLAVAEFYNNEWKVFTGNEIAALLGTWELEHYKGPKIPAFVASTVSSKFLKKVAQENNIHFEECLTGFKWIGNTALQLRQQGYDVIFAFEEAIGFCIGDIVPDKDGICAMSVFAQMAHYLHSQNESCTERLAKIQEKYGYFCSNNHYVVSYDKEKNIETFNKLRSPSYLSEANGYKVSNVRDLLAPGFDSQQKNNKPVLPTAADSQMITFYFDNGVVATLRMSGTEPKLKYYTELSGNNQAQTQEELDTFVEKAIKQFMLA